MKFLVDNALSPEMAELLATDASRPTALLVAYILPVCALLAPGRPGASTPRDATVISLRTLSNCP